MAHAAPPPLRDPAPALASPSRAGELHQLRLERKTALPTADVSKTLLPGDRTVTDVDPIAGIGVFDSLKAIAKLVLMELKKGASETPEE